MLLLLSLIPPSHIVVPNRELVNTLVPFDLRLLPNSQTQHNVNMNMEIDTLRGRSTNSSSNGSSVVATTSHKDQ